MMLPVVNNTEELLSQINSNDLYVKLIEQIDKDFSLIGITMSMNIHQSSLELFEQLKEVVTILLQQNFNDFLNLLYRIDISEQKISKIINNNTFDIEDQISFLILKREWQKVWFKEFYS